MMMMKRIVLVCPFRLLSVFYFVILHALGVVVVLSAVSNAVHAHENDRQVIL